MCSYKKKSVAAYEETRRDIKSQCESLYQLFKVGHKQDLKAEVWCHCVAIFTVEEFHNNNITYIGHIAFSSATHSNWSQPIRKKIAWWSCDKWKLLNMKSENEVLRPPTVPYKYENYFRQRFYLMIYENQSQRALSISAFNTAIFIPYETWKCNGKIFIA